MSTEIHYLAALLSCSFVKYGHLQNKHAIIMMNNVLGLCCSSSVDGTDEEDLAEDMTEHMELEQLQDDSAYDSFSSQGKSRSILVNPYTFHHVWSISGYMGLAAGNLWSEPLIFHTSGPYLGIWVCSGPSH